MNVVIQIQAVSGHKQFDVQGFHPGDIHALRRIWFLKSFQVLRFDLLAGLPLIRHPLGRIFWFQNFLYFIRLQEERFSSCY